MTQTYIVTLKDEDCFVSVMPKSYATQALAQSALVDYMIETLDQGDVELTPAIKDYLRSQVSIDEDREENALFCASIEGLRGDVFAVELPPLNEQSAHEQEQRRLIIEGRRAQVIFRWEPALYQKELNYQICDVDKHRLSVKRVKNLVKQGYTFPVYHGFIDGRFIGESSAMVAGKRLVEEEYKKEYIK